MDSSGGASGMSTGSGHPSTSERSGSISTEGDTCVNEPMPVPIQKLGQGCAVESLHGVLRVKEPGAPLTVFAFVKLSPEELVAHYGAVPAVPADFDLISYVNCALLWNRLRERGGQTLVDEVRGAIGLDPEAVSRARSAKEAEDPSHDIDGHEWLCNAPGLGVTTTNICRRCDAHEGGKKCRPFAPGDLEGMCQHDAYRNEACAECGREAEITVRTKADIQKLVIDHNALHPGKSKVVFDEAVFDDLLKLQDPSIVNSLYDAVQTNIEIEDLVFSGVPFDEAFKRVHGPSVLPPQTTTEEKP